MHHPQHLFSCNKRDRQKGKGDEGIAVSAHLQTAGHFARRERMMNQNLFPLASNHPLRLADLLIRAAAIYSMAQDRTVYQAIAIRDEWRSEERRVGKESRT